MKRWKPKSKYSTNVTINLEEEEEEEEEEVSFIKSITLCSPWTELRVLLQFIKIFKLYIYYKIKKY